MGREKRSPLAGLRRHGKRTAQRTMTEAQILHDILVALGRRQDLIIWRSQPLVATMRGRVVRALPNGHPDLTGCWRGLWFGIEVKSATGRQSPAQQAFQAAVEKRGGIYIVARSVEEATCRFSMEP